jgi:LAO/AO transport system kinase
LGTCEIVVNQKIKVLVDQMLKGDKASLAQLISLIERESPDVPEIMGLVSPFPLKVYRVGITGLAGAGKSTLVDKLTTFYRNLNYTIGIVAVDPSSVITGGAVLGDRIRMQQHYLDEGVFIRSMATRGCYGGLCKPVEDVVKLMNASGKDILIIETTGIGQTETNITRVADVVVLVLTPGFGDSIQLMKAGLIEIADIIVVNKADLEGAELLVNEIKDELSYSTRKTDQSVIMVQASNDIGVKELFEEIEKRRKSTESA